MQLETQRGEPWATNLRWLRYETAESYGRRLCGSVLGQPSLFESVARALKPVGTGHGSARASSLASLVEGWAGVQEGYFDDLVRAAQPIEEMPYRPRWLCRRCAAPFDAEQVPHDRENLCLTHRVWTGPGTAPETQLPFRNEPQLLNAERRFRRLSRAGRSNAYISQRAWEMVRDNATLTSGVQWAPRLTRFMARTGATWEVDGRAALYPETVAVIEVLSDQEALLHWSAPELTSEQLRQEIRDRLRFDGTTSVLVERIVLHLRPMRQRDRKLRLSSVRVPIDLIDTAACIDTSASGYSTAVVGNPRIVAEWDWSANPAAENPWDQGARLTSLQWWVCDKGHRWQAPVNYRGKGHNCKYCGNGWAWPGEGDLATVNPTLAAQWDSDPGANSCSPDQVSPQSNYRATWRCPLGHRWTASVSDRTGGTGCPFCGNQRAWPGFNDVASQAPALAAEWDTTEGANDRRPDQVVEFSTYLASWVCRADSQHRWKSQVDKRSRGNGCPYCAGRRVNQDNNLAALHPALAEEWDPTPEVNDRSPSQVRPGSSYRAGWVCSRGHTWRAVVSSRVKGGGCPACCNRRVEIGFNDLATTHPDLASQWDQTPGANDRGPSDVVFGSAYRASWVCQRGHRWSARVAARTSGRGCPDCFRIGAEVGAPRAAATEAVPDSAVRPGRRSRNNLVESRRATG